MDSQSAMSASSVMPSCFSESSRTCSTRSGGSARRPEPDYTRDNSATPVDMEALIQTERITKILDECIYKTKLAICLPELVKDFDALSSILSSEDMDDLVFIFEQYDDPMFPGSLLNMAALEEIKAGAVTLKERLNPELGHLMYIMNSYPALKPKVDAMIRLAKVQGESSSLKYLATLESFRELMVQQMSTSAAEELAGKITARKLERSNNKLVKQINEKTEKLAQEKNDFEQKITEKKEKIAQMEFERNNLRVEEAAKLKEKILDSDRQMVLASRAHAIKNDILQEELAEAQRAFTAMRAQHVREEKNLRAHRFKVETQLTSWLQKYDVEMTDKQVELDDYQKKYDEEVAKCKELEEKMELQNVDYIPLMAEREQEYQREMIAKMERFREQHAARILQAAWRNVLANRAEKKKLEKLLKKMQRAENPNMKKPAKKQRAQK